MIERYKDVYFLKGMPDILSLEEFKKKVRRSPIISKKLKGLDRLFVINELRYNFLEPLSRHYHLYLRLINVIYEGYKQRYPRDLPEYLTAIEQWQKNIKVDSYVPKSPFKRQALGFALFGNTGLGKTTLVDVIVSLLPQKILRKDKVLRTTQVPVVRIECTTKESTRELCCNILKSIDIQAGTSHLLQYGSVPSEGILMMQVVDKCLIHFVGVLIIDEIHNLRITSLNTQRVLNFLKSLSNVINLPIVFIGNQKAIKILSSDTQLARRIQGLGAKEWRRFKEEDAEWPIFLKALWRNHIFQKQPKLLKEVAGLYFYHSQGIPGVAVTLHSLALEHAYFKGIKTVDSDCLNNASQYELFLTIRAMHGLATKDREIIADLGDLGQFEDNLSSAESRPSEEEISKEFSILKDAIDTYYKNIPDQQVVKIIQYILDDFPTLSFKEKLFKFNEQAEIFKKEKKYIAAKRPKKGELVELVAGLKTPEEMYQTLKDNRFVGNLDFILQ